MSLHHVINAARETARQIELGINPSSPLDAEVKTHLAASWLTFAHLIEQHIRDENLAAFQDEMQQALWTHDEAPADRSRRGPSILFAGPSVRQS